MNSKWPHVTIESIAEKIAMGPFGSNIKVSTFVKNGIPIISGQHLHEARLTDSDYNFITEEHAEKLKNSLVYRGDIVFTHAGNIGQVAYIPDNSEYECYVLSQRQFYLRCDRSKVLPEFITYYFKTKEGQHKLLANSSQVGVPSIARPTSYLKTIEIPLPSLEEQGHIVRVITSLENKIDLNQQINQTLEQIAQAIFKSWFVDFEPVIAKFEAKEKGENTERAAMSAISGKTDEELDQLSPDQLEQISKTATLFPDKLVESEHGLIPDGWEWKQLGEVIEIFDSKRIPLSKNQRDKRKGPYPYYGAADIMDYIDDYIFDGTYVLMAEDGTVTDENGYPTMQYVWGKYWVNNHAHVLKGIGSVSDENILIYLKNTVINPYVTGAVQLKINQKNLTSIPFLKGNDTLHKFYAEILKKLFQLYKNKTEQNITLCAIRDILLPNLLSGKISILMES